MRQHRKVLSVVMSLLLITLMFTIACENFERTTFQTLKASQSAIDDAGHAYNDGKIQKTVAARDAILQARAAQQLAVEAFADYERVKITGSQTDIAIAQAKLSDLVARLPAIIADIRALK